MAIVAVDHGPHAALGRIRHAFHSNLTSSSGRRLSAHNDGRGSVLSGALSSPGYFSAVVCIGTPARSFEVVVDTGSAITSIPCNECRACGKHRSGRDGRYEHHSSSTAQRVACPAQDESLRCRQCSASGLCEFNVGYVEGSAIHGHVVRDVVHVTRAANASAEVSRVPMYLGCQTHETGKFRAQPADGILGLQPDGHDSRRSVLPNMVQALMGMHSSANAFSLCLGDSSGLLLLGGRTGGTSALVRRPGSATVGFMVAGSAERFALRLQDVRVGVAPIASTSAAARTIPDGLVSLRLPSSALNPVVVDSGTSFFFVPTPLWRAIHARMREHHRGLRRVGAHRVCAFMTRVMRDAMPSIELLLDGPRGARPLLIRPAQYMVEYKAAALGQSWPRKHRQDGAMHYCIDIFNNGRKGTVLGASVLRHREVIFDLSNNTIAFVDADCGSLAPEAAALRDAFAFAPCGEEFARGRR